MPRSAEWVLHVGLGEEVSVANASGKPVRLKIVGLLADSVFAGELLISDAQFRRHFGEGVRLALLPHRDAARPRGGGGRRCERTWARWASTCGGRSEVLAGYARVQNTYLATFQTLGGLGLLLGAFGIVTVRPAQRRRAPQRAGDAAGAGFAATPTRCYDSD